MHRQYARRRINRTLVTLVLGVLTLAGPTVGAVAQEATPAPNAPVELVWEIRGGAEPFAWPVAVAVDLNGAFWVTDGLNNNVQHFDADGTYIRTIGERGSGDGQFIFDKHTVNAVVDAAGNLFVGDHKNPRVQKFDRDGKFLLAFGSFGTGDGQFLNPATLGIDAKGNILVADDERGDGQWFDGNGTFLGKWGANLTTDDQTGLPRQVTFDSQGHLWAGTWDNAGVARVQEFDADGRLVRTVGSAGTGPDQYRDPVTVAVDKAGYIYIGDPTLAAVLVYDPAGNYLTRWSGSGVGDDRFTEVSHIALSPDGHIYVVDLNAGRVLKFRLLPPLAVEATPTA